MRLRVLSTAQPGTPVQRRWGLVLRRLWRAYWTSRAGFFRWAGIRAGWDQFPGTVGWQRAVILCRLADWCDTLADSL